jgi:acyl-coenzyme A synthetase/AMP-(fatty) acid ligase
MPRYLYLVDALPRNARGKIQPDFLCRACWTAIQAEKALAMKFAHCHPPDIQRSSI